MNPKVKKGLIAAAFAAVSALAVSYGIDPRIVGFLTELLNQAAQ